MNRANGVNPNGTSMDALNASRNLKDELAGLNETREAVENAENRARLEQQKLDSKLAQRNNREYAQALHREADQLYRSGDYETALVLYHRAANLCPKDSRHGVAARKTAATISSCNNPKALRKVSPGLVAGERLTAALCPETAAIMASEKLKKSPEPSSVAQVLGYLDNHRSYWKSLPSPRVSNSQLARSRMMTKQLNNLAESSLKDLRAAFDSGKMSAALTIGQELLVLSAGFQDPSRYQISAYHYLSLIHVALGRHDRAVCNVSRLVRLSRSTEDVVPICRSLVTLGKVHLSFGHLDAAAKAWEHLSRDLKAPIPVAWIRHEIGRCYLETGKYGRAAELACKCIEAALKANSKKWTLNGRLLLGQSLAKLGRFVDSLEELQIAAKITEEEGDTPMLSYIRDLIEQVARVLNRSPPTLAPIPYQDSRYSWEVSRISASQSQGQGMAGGSEDNRRVFVKRERTVITTVYTQRRAAIRDDSSCDEDDADSDADADARLTMHSDKPISLVQSYREDNAGTDRIGEDENGGGSTFRIGAPPSKQDDRSPSDSFASSSSASISSFASNLDELDEEDESAAADKSRQVPDERETRDCDSKVSLNSTATYTIGSQPGLAGMKQYTRGQDQGNKERDLGNGIPDKNGEERINVGTYSVDKTAEQSEAMLNALKVIEELGEKDEVELLDMLRDMMLAGEGKEPMLDYSGDGFRSSRSDQDRMELSAGATGKSPATRSTPLPSTARICDAHGDFRDAGVTRRFD